MESTISVPSKPGLTLRGDGKATRLLWDRDADLFLWNETAVANQVTLQGLTVESSNRKTATSTAFRWTHGVTQSLIDAVWVVSASATAAAFCVGTSGTRAIIDEEDGARLIAGPRQTVPASMA